MNSSLQESELDEEEKGSRISSIAFGIVLDNSDTDGDGKVLVKLYSLSEDGDTLPYNRICRANVFYINKSSKEFRIFIPEINDQVIVTFQTRGYDNPLIVGIIPKELQTSMNGADVHNNEEIRSITRILTRAGYELFFDTTLENQVEIHTKSGSIIRVDESNNNSKIMIGNKNANHNNNWIIIDTSSEQISITTKKDLRIKAPNIEIESAENMNLKCGSTMTLNGSIVKIN